MPRASIWYRLRHSAENLCHPERVALAAPLGWWQRQLLSWRALWAFLGSLEALRLALWACACCLLAQLVSWRLDLTLRDSATLLSVATLWIWPWLASARRRHIEHLLRRRKQGD